MNSRLCIFGTIIVLGALGADKLWFKPPVATADVYHSRVRAAAALVAPHFDSWMGEDVPVPAGAIKMLHPNVLLSRRFVDLDSGDNCVFLLVQVHDARDVIGHFPPVCYPNQGWTLRNSIQTDWNAAGWVAEGSEYSFTRDTLDGASEIIVDNFMLLPSGETCRNLDEIEVAAQSRYRKLFGAAEAQMVFDKPLTPERRRSIVEKVLAFHRPLLDAIRSGEKL